MEDKRKTNVWLLEMKTINVYKLEVLLNGVYRRLSWKNYKFEHREIENTPK
jgi:hypothetical protein